MKKKEWIAWEGRERKLHLGGYPSSERSHTGAHLKKEPMRESWRRIFERHDHSNARSFPSMKAFIKERSSDKDWSFRSISPYVRLLDYVCYPPIRNSYVICTRSFDPCNKIKAGALVRWPAKEGASPDRQVRCALISHPILEEVRDPSSKFNYRACSQ